MKLLFDLPAKEKYVIEKFLNGEEIIYCVPVDINPSGQYSEGWLVITGRRILYLDSGEIVREFKISEGNNYKAVGMVGSGILEGTFEGKPRLIARYTMSHVPRYSFLAKALNQISSEGSSRVKSFDEENRCPRCGRVYPEGTRVCSFCTNKLSVLKRLLGVAKPYWFFIFVAVILFFAITGLQLIIPYVYRKLIDGYLIVKRKELWSILLWVGAIAGCNLMSNLFAIIRGRLMVVVGSKVSRDLRQQVYNKIQALSLSYINQKKTGDLMNRVTGDTERIKNFIQEQATMGINQTFILLGVGIILFASNWRLALFIVLPAPFVVLLYRAIWSRISLMYHQQWRAVDKANSILQDILSGIRVVKAFGQEDKEVERFKKASKLVAEYTGRNEKAWNTLFPAMGYILGIGNFLVLYFGGSMVIGHQMKLGELVQFSQYAAMVYGPLNWMSFIPRWFAEAMTSTERIFEILDQEPDVSDRVNAIHHKIKGNVVFENVTFGYRSHEPVLEGINLEVKSGEMIGLVGHSGSGKSTFINLLMRLYDVDEGRILIDGIDIRDIYQRDLRSQIGVVLQETFLFSGTILENIRYSKPNATLDEVIRAAKIANAHDFIMGFPDGYDTVVGEKGMRLSGGERQRIAIARAILNDPKILILDEATASLDTETEQQIQEALSRLIKDRTTFAIAHRLSTLRNADRLVVIDQGKIAEVGTHEELIKARGIYYNLVMAQRQMTRYKNNAQEISELIKG